jgi:hypothetical protein
VNASQPISARFARFYMVTANVAFVLTLNVRAQATTAN